MDVRSPEGGSPTHALLSLSGRDNERGSEKERQRYSCRFFFKVTKKTLNTWKIIKSVQRNKVQNEPRQKLQGN